MRYMQNNLAETGLMMIRRKISNDTNSCDKRSQNIDVHET